MKLPCVLTMIGLGVAPQAAQAQPVTQPAEVDEDRRTVGVEVMAPNAEVDAAEIRAAIAADLGADIIVTDAAAFAPGLGRLEILVNAGLIRIAYHPAPGTVIERQLALPIAPAERVQLIAYVATNLVRDQAGEILAELPRVVIPPPADAARPRTASAPTRRVPVTLGFVPPASIDRAFGERVVVGAGLHALVGMTTGSEVASVSGIADIQREFARGVQIGGVAAVSRGTTDGVQIGGVATFTQTKLEGAQIAGVASVTRGDVHGAQVGGVMTTSRDLDGLQVAGVANIARGDVDGVQVGGVANIAGRVEGVQIGGVANVGGDVRGVQIGVVNAARRMRGVQIGVVNINTEDGDDAIPIGLVNYARNGRLAAEAWVESSRLSAVGVRHGTRRVHNVWGLAWSPDHDHVLAGVGLGAHVPLDGPTLDVDAMYWMTNVWGDDHGQISQLRASVTLPIGGVEVFGGAAANLYISDEMDESANFHPVLERRTTTSGGRAIVAWPTGFVGVRLRAR